MQLLQSKNFTIESCRESEIEVVMRFIGEHWKENHILSQHRHPLI